MCTALEIIVSKKTGTSKKNIVKDFRGGFQGPQRVVTLASLLSRRLCSLISEPLRMTNLWEISKNFGQTVHPKTLSHKPHGDQHNFSFRSV